MDCHGRLQKDMIRSHPLGMSITITFFKLCLIYIDSDFIDKSMVPDPHQLELVCKVNGTVRQQGTTKDMIFKYAMSIYESQAVLMSRIPELIQYISRIMKLEPGDVILTGMSRDCYP